MAEPAAAGSGATLTPARRSAPCQAVDSPPRVGYSEAPLVLLALAIVVLFLFTMMLANWPPVAN